MAHQQDHHQGQPHGHQHGGPKHGAGETGLADMLDLDAEVMASYLSEIMSWVGQHTDGIPRRVLDLGAGTGTGTVALARCFDPAEVIAVDAAEESLARIHAKVADLGLADRVSTVGADVDEGWPDLEPVDLAWASNSLHEMADPDRVFAQLFATLNPGGLLAVAEMDGFPLFLPEDIGMGRPGLETRVHEALAEARSDTQPRLGPDWEPNLVRAGFAVRATRRFTIELAAPVPAATGRYAQTFLLTVRAGLADKLGAEDLAVLDTLNGDGPDSLLHRADLVVRNTRTGWIAAKP